LTERSRSGGSSAGRPGRPRLGQHFLVDRTVAARIVTAFAPAAGDHVVEVGPGRGVLTERLAGRVERLVAVELDRRLAADLAGRSLPGVEVLQADFRRTSLAALRQGPPLRLLANLPYHISSDTVLKLLDEWRTVGDATLLVQREFAARLAAPTGGHDYGSLTALTAARFAVAALGDVPPGAFRPRPRVWSRLVRLEPLAEPLADDPLYPSLAALLRAAFSVRRKMLDNALRTRLGIDRERVREALALAGVEPTARAENVPPATWAALARGPLGDACAPPSSRSIAPGGGSQPESIELRPRATRFLGTRNVLS
jgi:16S rRNA (adenine1518-N6/adenine1519-N6)-dimethyltransferase